MLSSSSSTGSGDFLSSLEKKKRNQTEQSLEGLTEEGWEKKVPTTEETEETEKTEKIEDSEQPSSSSKNTKKKPEVDGPKGPEPTRYGDWERAGRCSDF